MCPIGADLNPKARIPYTQKNAGLKSVRADMLVLDDLDEAEPQAKAMALERLAHSRFKRIIELSNPSFPDFGIDEAFRRSDQRF